MLKTAEVIELLHGTDIFAHISKEGLQILAMHVSQSEISEGQKLITKGDVSNSMFVIVTGEVNIHDAQHVVQTMHAGDYFGELSLLDDEPRSMSVTATANGHILEITRKALFHMLQAYPALSHSIMPVLTKRMRTQSKYIIEQLRNKENELQHLVNVRTMQLQAKNREMLDSIYYAKHVQEAILPSAETMQQLFSEMFVLYLPKDIVSGDFYWAVKMENYIFLAVADCTGHGVSGALMSMLGVSLLDQLVKSKKMFAPDAVLNEMHNSIVTVLQQETNNTNNGMDIIFCCIDIQKMELQYAGANRPLMFVRKGELVVLAPNKMPVGGTQIEHDTLFTSYKMKLEPGDMFYLSTDGYADQFGGDAGKKLMTKKLKDMLLQNKDASMSEQKEFLENYFYEWKKEHEQVDDVLIIGFRIS